MRRFVFMNFVLMIVISGLIVGCENATERGDYIVGKMTSSTPKIVVARNITKKESKKSQDEHWQMDTEMFIYWVKDWDLYQSLQIGDRVTVKLKTEKMDGQDVFTIMTSDPPQGIADEIIVHAH